jgi:hypothetical protein
MSILYVYILTVSIVVILIVCVIQTHIVRIPVMTHSHYGPYIWMDRCPWVPPPPQLFKVQLNVLVQFPMVLLQPILQVFYHTVFLFFY